MDHAGGACRLSYARWPDQHPRQQIREAELRLNIGNSNDDAQERVLD